MGDLNFTALTDKKTWFQNAAAFNNWVEDITLKSSALVGSAASTTTAGVVKQVVALTYTYTSQSYGSTYYDQVTIEDPDGTLRVVQVANKAAFDKALQNIAELKAILDDLKTKMIAAGVLAA